MKLVVKAAVLNFITLLVRHGINLGIVIYTARHFGAASVGALSFFTILVGVFSVLGPFGIVSAYVQSNKDFPDSTFASSVIVSFVFCFASLCFFSLSLILFDSDLFLKSYLLFWISGVVLIVFRSLSSIFEGKLLAELKFDKQSLCESFSFILALIVLIAAISWAGANIWLFIFYHVIQAVFYASLTGLVAGKSEWIVDKNVIAQFFKTSLLQVFAQISNVIATNADNVLLAKFLGASVLGFYSRAYQLLLLPSVLIGQVIQKIAFPLLRSGKAGFSSSHFLEMSLKIMLMPSVLVGWIFYNFSAEIVYLIYGQGWSMAADVLKIFSFFVFPRVYYKAAESVILSSGQVKLMARVNAMYAFVMVCIVLFCLNLYDVYLMSLGVGIVVTVYSAILTFFAVRLAGASISNLRDLAVEGVFLFLLLINSFFGNFWIAVSLFALWGGCYFSRFFTSRGGKMVIL